MLKGLPSIKGDTRTGVDMLMDIFKNVGKEDENKVENQCINMSAAAAERTKSDEAEEQVVWIEPDEANLADNEL